MTSTGYGGSVLHQNFFKFGHPLVFLINTLWTGDADLRLCITTVQDG